MTRYRRTLLLGVVGTLVVLFGKDTVLNAFQALSIFLPAQ